jgi:hypothetical protein
LSSRFPPLARPSPFRPFLRRFTDERARDLAETISLYNKVRAAHLATAWSNPDAVNNLSDHIASAVIEAVEQLTTYEPLGDALDICQRELLKLETSLFSPPTADFTKPLSLKEQIDLTRDLRAREYLISRQDEVYEKLVTAIGNLTAAVLDRIPQLDDTLFRVPLISLIQDPLEFLEGIIGIFFKPEYIEIGLFNNLSAQIMDNMNAVSGIDDPATSKKPVVWPTQCDLSIEEAVDAYFAGTPIHTLLLTPCPFDIPAEQRFSGHWIIAPPGRGKTTLLHTMFLNDLDEDASIIVIDSKGDLLDPIKRFDLIKDRLLLIEPSADYAFALNPLDVSQSSVMHAVNMIEYIMAGLLDAKFTALQSTLFRNAVPAIIEAFDQPTLDTFKSVMVHGLPAETMPRLDPHCRAFFENRDTGFHSKTYESTRREVVWRLDYLMTNPVIRTMFSAVQTKLDIGKEMDDGKIILINNSKSILTDEGAEFFGRFFLALIVRAAQQRAGRPAAEKKPCYVYVDECQTVIAKDTRIPTLLDECRSQKIALILSHQRSAQLTAPVLDAAANCAIRMANSDDEAKYLADKIRMPAETLRSLPRGSFGTFIRDFSPPGFVLKVPRYDVGKLPRMTDAEFEAIRDRMKRDFSSSLPEKPTEAAPPRPQSPKPRAPQPAVAGETVDSPNEPSNTPDPGEPADKW